MTNTEEEFFDPELMDVDECGVGLENEYDGEAVSANPFEADEDE